MKSIKSNIPKYLKKYIVNQDYNKYSYIDHACWRFIMKISLAFFSQHADKIYKEGLEETGITLDKIPKINSINKKLKKFGWSAVCVRGFIPPQIFMEFQSLKILPIAADMRHHKHLTYTPAPDIVHEAAGHAPIIANQEYSKYLMDYGEIASKAIMSNEDMELYYAIRDLSDAKENTQITDKQIKMYQDKLKKAYSNITYLSESSMLSRMNWWTVEYGLMGDIKNPKIYGAGLLSSVAESQNCLDEKVKKIPLTIDCIKYKYDITEQQPQLFVTPNYRHLRNELKKLSKQMSYKTGGQYGLDAAIKAKTICTIELDYQLGLSGVVKSYIKKNKKIIFVQLDGPTQISYKNKQINGHDKNYHKLGYSTPIGKIKSVNKNLNQLNKLDIENLNIKLNKYIEIKFMSGINLSGTIKKIIKKSEKIILISFKDCLVQYKSKKLFKPEWGTYDLACGEKINSVFGGPADKSKYFSDSLKTNYQYNKNKSTIIDNELNDLYKKIWQINKKNQTLNNLEKIYNIIQKKYPNEWLIKYEILELSYKKIDDDWVKSLEDDMFKLASNKTDFSNAVKRGLDLIIK